MKALYFFRGIWRELVCLVNKTVKFWQRLNWQERAAILWTLVGVVCGLIYAYVTIMQTISEMNEMARLYSTYTPNFGLSFFAGMICLVLFAGSFGALVVWVPVIFVVGAYLFVKHTIEVGQK